MILNLGEKIHVIHRQLFAGDVKRHFIGRIEGTEGPLVRVQGYLFAMDTKLNQFARRDTLRTRIISLDSDSVIVNVLPEQVEIENVSYDYRSRGDIVVTDGGDWHLDITHL
ncbi:MAG: hypothetical protein DVB32_04865 [Verrucomicrobia bacterium]|nr:MAG: hypothetical protein DVB32_04865 [Verrucomicrobiota bacterium]MCX6882063.1 hypothetical protein [Verrucomicrobiota bacterium]